MASGVRRPAGCGLQAPFQAAVDKDQEEDVAADPPLKRKTTRRPFERRSDATERVGGAAPPPNRVVLGRRLLHPRYDYITLLGRQEKPLNRGKPFDAEGVRILAPLILLRRDLTFVDLDRDTLACDIFSNSMTRGRPEYDAFRSKKTPGSRTIRSASGSRGSDAQRLAGGRD
jgi:hypothetical protein